MATVSVPAGTETSAQVIATGRGSSVNRILVTGSGTADLVFYDNASEASGVIIAFVPASTPAGTFLGGLLASNGVVAALNPGTPAVTVDYSAPPTTSFPTEG